MVCRLDFGERRTVSVPRALLFEAARRDVAFPRRAFLARTLRAARGFRAADFFAELFFFFSRFAIDVSAL